MCKHFNVCESEVIAPSFKRGFNLRRMLDCHSFKANGINKKTFYAAAAHIPTHSKVKQDNGNIPE